MKKNGKLKVPSLANPAMPVPVPNFIGALPGMTAVATKMMQGWLDDAKLPALAEFLDTSRELGVRFFACSTTMGGHGRHQ